jgi:transcriptional regulator with XRE-family HTH domain
VIDYRIRDCRDRQGLTITQIARTLGVHRQTVAKYARSASIVKFAMPDTRSTEG